ncbi:nitrate- and nitrite sensing domain-containing protein [Nonomuraea sp. ZG12]|uniref:sensor histidine kinase n=1 Tax=Nonomuraea sp. ZG12 TaxID=3452207 RepID=UPI003F88AD23
MASGRSIRFKISTLLVIPLISLVVLWGFAASTTSKEALSLLKVEAIWRGVIDHTETLTLRLQEERLASAELIGGATDAAALAAARGRVDEAEKTLTAQAKSDSTQSALTPEMRTQLTAMLKAVDRLPEIRRQADSGQLTPHTLITEYATIPDAIDDLYSAFTVSTDVELARQANGLIVAQQVRELLSREHALIVAGNAAPGADKWTMDEVHLLAGIDGARTYLFPKAMANLDDELRAPLEAMRATPRYATMERSLEGYVTGKPIDMQLWRGTVDPVLTEFSQALGGSGDVLLARMEPAGMVIIVRAVVTGALGLIAVVFSIFISIRVARRVSGELTVLRHSALDLAENRLPTVVTKLRQGEDVDIEAEAPRIEVRSDATREVADLATAFDSVQRTAVDAAVEQARLREGISEALRNLARRTQSLVQRQIKQLDEMQRQTEEPEALERLFKLDHLTTRMRRHAEGLVLLAGGSAGRRWRGVIPMEDVLSGAAGQVEEYTRVRVYPMPEAGVTGAAVADLMHLFAELIENAATFSSPGNEVSVRGDLVGKGFAVEIEDRGLGMSQEARDAINRRLARPAEFDPAQSERLGFSVVAMLAARHGIGVTLKPSPYGGTTAIVLVPAGLVQQLPAMQPSQMPELESISVSVVGGDPGPGELPRRIRTHKRGVEAASPQALASAPPAQGDLPTRTRTQPPAQDELPARRPVQSAGPDELPARRPVPSSDQGELPARTRAQSPAQGDLPVRAGAQSSGEEELAPTPTPAPATAQAQAAGAGLPRRVRQANLPPKLQKPAPAPAGPVESRSPEEARALLSSLQSGWQRGRQDTEQNGGGSRS